MPLNFTVQDILVATDGVLLQGRPSVRVKAVSTDTRAFKKGALFLAIKGENFDGHNFIGKVAAKACAVIVSRPDIRLSQDKPVIYVKDTVKALGEIAAAHRHKFRIPVIAITGSSGKTTTKDMIAVVLSRRYNVLYNLGTQNNQIGVPQTLLKLEKKHKAAVLELGTNRFGDIEWLTKITVPSVAVYTTIGASHLEGLRTPAGVFQEKLDLMRFMSPRGKAVVNEDNIYLSRVKRIFPKRVIGFGIRTKTQFQATDVRLLDNELLQFCCAGHSFTLNTPVLENVYNALAAIACGRMLKVNYRDIQKALARFHFSKGRQAVQKVNDCWLIDDSYNANPVSFYSAINTLSRLDVPGRKILVCADMLELGKESAKLHSAVGKAAAQSDIDLVLTFGRWAQKISDAVRRRDQNDRAFHFRSLDLLHKKLKSYCRRGDAVLVKGSRGMRMERTVEFLNKKIFSHN